MLETIVGVKCKLTHIEIARHSYGHCVSHAVSEFQNQTKSAILSISLLSRLGKTYDYISLKLFFFVL